MTPTPVPDLDRVAALIRTVGETIILPHFRSLADAGIREKTGPLDLVTKADLEAEAALTPQLAALVPGSVVVGEEAVSADPGVLDRMRGEAPVWIIDPVDGTINFANGTPAFAVIVAYAHRGETLAGWIHDPVSGRTAVAEKGAGCRLDGRPVRLEPAPPPAAMRGALSTRFCSEAMGARLAERGRTLGGTIYLKSAAQEYLRMLDGSAHFSLYNRLMPWDHAAGALMVTEAGGRSALVDGRPYGPTIMEGALLNAVDAAAWEALAHHLYG